MKGTVYLVGAGPGDPELLTLKAARVIGLAQAVVYDRLVSDEIMQLVPPGVPRFFAGKSCKQKAMTQDEINELLAALAKKYDHVLRLKGGDPLLFGRGGEEALHLASLGVGFEIVPGITSAQGCAAYAGIPLTHRHLATGVRFITGHRVTAEDVEDPLDLNWQSLADPDTTLVVYMGLANLETIATKLMEHGLSPDTPAAAIEQGTTAKQRVIPATLKTLHATTKKADLQPPTLAIIGKVAALASELAWFSPETGENQDGNGSIFTQLSHLSR
jgi:uroporphyrin-III C-methyltransferase